MPLLQQVLEGNPDKVKVVFKHFPLAMHKMARKAAAASLAANEQGKFWDYHDTLFKNVSSLSDAKLQEIAEKVGLDKEKFGEDLVDSSIQKAITSDLRNGQQAGVRGTPTVFINGIRMKSRSRQSFQKMIDAELKKIHEESAAD